MGIYHNLTNQQSDMDCVSKNPFHPRVNHHDNMGGFLKCWIQKKVTTVAFNTKLYGGFHQWGYPLVVIIQLLENGIFHEINHPFLSIKGYPMTMEPPSHHVSILMVIHDLDDLGQPRWPPMLHLPASSLLPRQPSSRRGDAPRTDGPSRQQSAWLSPWGCQTFPGKLGKTWETWKKIEKSGFIHNKLGNTII